MKKGFNFWTSKAISSFIKKYWIIYFVFFVLAIWLTIKISNPFLFLIVGFLPCPILWIYRVIHNPSYNLEKSIREIDPEFYKLLIQRSSKMQNIKIATSKRKLKEGFLQISLLNWEDNNMDQRIVTYIENNKRINKSSMISLSIWFLTFMIFVFVLFFIKQ